MNKKYQIVSIGLVIALICSIGFNVYLINQNKELNTRINNFIPAAMNMESEQQRLLQKEKEQQAKIDELNYFKDSISTSGQLKRNGAAQLEPTMNIPQTVPQDPAMMNSPNGDRTFEDLNKPRP